MLTIGIPKEIKPMERRVGLIPSAVFLLVQKGFTVHVEKDAGVASGFANELYQRAGARLFPDAKELYASSELIQKVKEPLEEEFSYLQKNHYLFCFLHLSSHEHKHLTKALMDSKVVAIGYETLVEEGRIPLLAPMSQIAGGLGASYAALIQNTEFQEIQPHSPIGFFEKLEECARFYPKPITHRKIGEVVIFGGGIAGKAALDMIQKMGGKPIIVEKNSSVISDLSSRGITVYEPLTIPDSVLNQADILMGCAHSVGQRAVQIMDLTKLKSISQGKKKIIIDIAIDQGGNFPEARSTTYQDPIYYDSLGNIRFSVANIPSLAGHAASTMLCSAAMRYTEKLAKDPRQAFSESGSLFKAINIMNGKIMLDSIRNAHPELLAE